MYLRFKQLYTRYTGFENKNSNWLTKGDPTKLTLQHLSSAVVFDRHNLLDYIIPKPYHPIYGLRLLFIILEKRPYLWTREFLEKIFGDTTFIDQFALGNSFDNWNHRIKNLRRICKNVRIGRTDIDLGDWGKDMLHRSIKARNEKNVDWLIEHSAGGSLSAYILAIIERGINLSDWEWMIGKIQNPTDLLSTQNKSEKRFVDLLVEKVIIYSSASVLSWLLEHRNDVVKNKHYVVAVQYERVDMMKVIYENGKAPTNSEILQVIAKRWNTPLSRFRWCTECGSIATETGNLHVSKQFISNDNSDWPVLLHKHYFEHNQKPKKMKTTHNI
jgi:hypothetical protein